MVRDAEGTISYNEYSFAKTQRLSTAQIVTPAGSDPVPITAATVGKTISAATIKGEGNDLVLDTSANYKPHPAPTRSFWRPMSWCARSTVIRPPARQCGRSCSPPSAQANSNSKTTATFRCQPISNRKWPRQSTPSRDTTTDSVGRTCDLRAPSHTPD